MAPRDKTLNQIIGIADACYGEGEIGRCWNSAKSAPLPGAEAEIAAGDTLALFLARELADVCEGEGLLDGLREASIAVDKAANQLLSLAAHLEAAARAEEIRLTGGASSS